MTDEHVCPECEEHERRVTSLTDALCDAIGAWLKKTSPDGVEFDVVVSGQASVLAETLAQITDVEDRTASAAGAIGVILEASGCDVGSVLEYLRETFADEMTPAGSA